MATYWNALGLSGSAVSVAVENAARNVQWAQYALTQGATANEAKVRYNLDLFWKAKAAAYPSESSEGRLQFERLDGIAHGLWNALETGKIYSAVPSYGDFYLKNVITGGTPSRPDSDAAAIRAKAAALGAAAASSRAVMPKLDAFYQKTALDVNQHKTAAFNMWNQEGSNILGLPVWAWLVGGGLLAVLLLTRD